jgi:hypothetical protein
MGSLPKNGWFHAVLMFDGVKSVGTVLFGSNPDLEPNRSFGTVANTKLVEKSEGICVKEWQRRQQQEDKMRKQHANE